MLTRENYHSIEMNNKYMSNSVYKDFCGSIGLLGCPSRALAKLRGDYVEEPTPAMLVSSYVDNHYSATLDVFRAKNPNIFTKKGELKSEFKKAKKIIERTEKDKYFSKYMAGEKQVIMTAKIFGCEWKILIDSYLAGLAIVDLKVMADLRKAFWVKDYGYCSFVEYYGYIVQGCIYSEVVEQNTGTRLPFFIAGASKESEPDIEIIGIDKLALRNSYIEIKNNINRIMGLKAGKVEPDKCNVCPWCKQNKVLTKPVHYSNLIRKI